MRWLFFYNLIKKGMLSSFYIFFKLFFLCILLICIFIMDKFEHFFSVYLSSKIMKFWMLMSITHMYYILAESSTMHIWIGSYFLYGFLIKHCYTYFEMSRDHWSQWIKWVFPVFFSFTHNQSLSKLLNPFIYLCVTIPCFLNHHDLLLEYYNILPANCPISTLTYLKPITPLQL